ncbi:5'/3'-nucleotidase SurE [Halorussus aquaticus]|uniref:5'-nucleotidase SurE n=1 Tax=Halorussus aquaticus TaxID=2953748 RepID=A0ABD5PX73_9EURY|nr:5'/3'-nucleotidase SurE [Halorussus aquaticus]
MNASPNVLLTNDDGIDAIGLRAMHDALSAVADVTVVAPDGDRSGVSRADSLEFEVEKRSLGIAVDGTPVDCVQYARGGLDAEFDVVVSGCNDGPNLGAHKIERSGTVCAAIEAGFLGIPGVALSVYDPPEGSREFDREDYAEAGRVAEFLVRRLAAADLPEGFDYLNVNVPADADDPRLRVTEPAYHFDVRIDETDDGSYRAWDHFYDPLHPDVDAEMTDDVGTDRRAVADEEISVSPLSVRHRTPDAEAVEPLVADYPERVSEV